MPKTCPSCAPQGFSVQPKLFVVPIEFKTANRFIGLWHRHHKPAQGHRFSLGAVLTNGTLVGVIICGRPVARLAGNPLHVLEVTRLATDGTPNACSCLYAAAARVGKVMGFKKIQTYILESENGVSLIAAGWTCKGASGGGQWKHTDCNPRRTDHPTCEKKRWEKILNETDIKVNIEFMNKKTQSRTLF